MHVHLVVSAVDASLQTDILNLTAWRRMEEPKYKID